MTPSSLFVRVLGDHRDGQWSLLCLDFDLAAQADTLDQKSATSPALQGGEEVNCGDGNIPHLLSVCGSALSLVDQGPHAQPAYTPQASVWGFLWVDTCGF